MDYFISDLHAWHKNVLSYCQRPFSSVEEMNTTLITNWNLKVKDEDTVYVLGDFCLSTFDRIKEFREQLKGRHILIKGNHDRSAKRMLEAGFSEVHWRLELDTTYGKVLLSHKPPWQMKPPVEGEELKKYAYVLIGHVHNLWKRQGNIINVGVDIRGFEPKTLEELINDQST